MKTEVFCKNFVSEPYYKNDLVGNMSFKDVFHPWSWVEQQTGSAAINFGSAGIDTWWHSKR